LLALLALPLLIVAHPVLAAEECTRADTPFVRLNENYGDVRYIAASSAEIRRLHGRHARPVAGWEPIGITLAELGLGISVSVRSFQMSNGRFCSFLSAVEANVGYDAIDVYILRKYQRGSCEYSVVLNHEREHVVVFESTLSEYLPRLRSTIEESAVSIEPIRSRDRNKAAQQMRRELSDAVSGLLDEISATLDRRNARLDTIESYRRLQRECSSW